MTITEGVAEADGWLVRLKGRLEGGGGKVLVSTAIAASLATGVLAGEVAPNIPDLNNVEKGAIAVTIGGIAVLGVRKGIEWIEDGAEEKARGARLSQDGQRLEERD